jgi:hypothetical protein
MVGPDLATVPAVIASAAKQSSGQFDRRRPLDCFVAALLAMTAETIASHRNVR